MKQKHLKKIFVFVMALSFFTSLTWAAEPLVSDQELNQTLSYLLQIMPTRISEALKDKIVVRAVKSRNPKIDKSKMSLGEDIHKLSSFQRWHNKWIINIDKEAKVLASCQNTDCKLDLSHLILHNIAHIYDDLNILFPTTKYEEKIFQFCSVAYQISRNSPPPECQIISHIEKSISDHRDFSERVYSNVEIDEAFPINFSDFVLSSDFACRHPSLDSYFEQRIGPAAKVNHRQCQMNYLVPYMGLNSGDSAPLNLDPARIYRVDYLLASEGEGMESSLGHTMFRLVVCAPDRTEVSEKCIEDTAFHIAVGFTAYQDGDNSEWLGLKTKLKGISGGYPSVLSIEPLVELVKQYNVSEDRALKAYPLKLSKAEVKNFVLQTIETYWNHNKDYYFLTNNCASEGFGLLKRSLNRPYNEVFNSGVKILSPKGLLENLEKANLISYRVTEKSKDEKYPTRIFEPDVTKDRYINYFPSKAEIAIGNSGDEVKKYWNYDSKNLRKTFDLLSTNPEKKYQYAGAFRIMEKTRLNRLNQKFTIWMQQQLTTASDAELRRQSLIIEKDFLDLMKKLRLRKLLDEKDTTFAGGIPINNELSVPLQDLVAAQEAMHEKFKELREKINDSKSDIKVEFKGREEIKTAKENLAYYDKIVSQQMFKDNFKSGRTKPAR